MTHIEARTDIYICDDSVDSAESSPQIDSPEKEFEDFIALIDPRVREYYRDPEVEDSDLERERLDAKVCSEALRLSESPRMMHYVREGWLSADRHAFHQLRRLHTVGDRRMEGKLYLPANKTGKPNVRFERLIDEEIICVLAEMREKDPTQGGELNERWYDLVTEDSGSEYLFVRNERGVSPLIQTQEMREFFTRRE